MDIRKLKDIHLGGRVFITASGPSLLYFEPEELKDEIIITVNETITRFPWAKYSIALDRVPYDICLKYDSILLTTQPKSYLPNVIHTVADGRREVFTRDMTSKIAVGGTSTYVALELAIWLGFKDIYICGLDLKRGEKQTHFYGNQKNFETRTISSFALMKQSFNYASTVLSDVNVVNCSLESELLCFPKLDIYEVLNESG